MGAVMLRLILLLFLPCINGQGFQSSITPNWGQQIRGPSAAANQERLLESLINRGWTPPMDVQRELATASQVRQAVTGRGGDGFGNRFDFGFTPDQLMAPGLSINDLIPTNNGGGRFGNTRDAGAANSLASLPSNMQIPGSLTQGLVNRGLMDPALVNPNFGGRGLIDPTLQGTGFIDPILQGRGFPEGRGLIDPTFQGRGLTGPSLADAALLGRHRAPGMVNIIPDGGLFGPGGGPAGLGPLGPGVHGSRGSGLLGPGGPGSLGLGPLGPGIGPLDPIGPGVIGIAGHDHHHGHEEHGIKVVKNELVKNKIIKKQLKNELRARKQDKIIKKQILTGNAGIGDTNGEIVAHGDHFHLDNKVLKVVGTSRTHHPPPPPRRNRQRDGIKSLVHGLLLGGIGALLGKK